jgi:hypothetical protein
MNVAERMLSVDVAGGQEEEESIQRVVDVNWAFGEWI